MEFLFGLQIIGIILNLFSISSLRVISTAALVGSSYLLLPLTSFWSTALIFSLTFHSTTDPLELLLFCTLFYEARQTHPNFKESNLKLTVLWFVSFWDPSPVYFKNSIVVLLAAAFSSADYSVSSVEKPIEGRPRMISFESEERPPIQKSNTGSDISISSNFSVQRIISKLRNNRKLRKLRTERTIRDFSEEEDPKTPMSVGFPFDDHFESSNEEEENYTNNLSRKDVELIIKALVRKETSFARRKTTIDIHEEEQAAYTQSSGTGPRHTANPHSHRPMIRRIKTMIEENEDLQNLLETLGEWDFNSFELLNETHYPLFELASYAFSTMGLNEEFNINTGTLNNFLKKVDQSYIKSNFYHNSLHAADVTASMIYLLHSGLERCGNLEDIEVLSLVVASLCHDINHPGFNNAYLVTTKDKLALKFNDSSVLENMHSNLTFRILNKESHNIIENLSEEDYRTFRKYVITLILSTDLQKHFEKLKLFETGIEEGLSFENEEFKLLSMQIAIKCADIGHGARSLLLHEKWSGLITKEFFREGEMEREKGIPVSPLMNSEEVVVCKSQIGFINFMVKPLFESFVQFIESNHEFEEEELDIEVCLRNIKGNLQFWMEEADRYDSGNPTYFLDEDPPLLEFK